MIIIFAATPESHPDRRALLIQIVALQPTRIKVIYCTQSSFKREEWDQIKLGEIKGSKIDDLFDVEYRFVQTDEPLNCDIVEMVRVKAASAYKSLMVPCIVEHAGIVLNGFENLSYPGGLTQPMWDAIGAELFVKSCTVLASGATARAVIGYCDGSNIHTFVGETKGQLSTEPRGERTFYWDTVFCPEGGNGKTYAEIVGADGSGLPRKVALSQSRKAMEKFLKYRIDYSPALFP